MKPCRPCELKRQRLQAKLNATKDRAIQWAKEQHLSEVVVFMPEDEEGENDCYSFGRVAPKGSTCVEYLSVL